MGQRFQILIQVDDNLAVYHCQWLWSAYAIRRLGSLVYAIQERMKKDKYFDAHRDLDNCVKWAFLHKLQDQNNIYPYFDDVLWVGEKELKDDKSMKGFMNSLDNNNGQFYLKIKSSTHLSNDEIVGYAFYNPRGYTAEKERQGKLIDYKEYLKDYKDNLFNEFGEERKREYRRGVKVLSGLKVLDKLPSIKTFKK